MADDPFIQPWHNQTTLHPFGLAAALLCGFALLVLPRRFAPIPLLVLACFVAPAQRLVVLGFDFNLLRLMVVIGWTRLILRREWWPFSVNRLDGIVTLWALSGAIVFTFTHGTMDAVVNRLGFLFDALGMYFLFRVLIRDWCDLRLIAACAALIAVPVAGAFLIEKATARNMFAFLGGVPEITTMRAGQLRCQGAFAHPILAGSFWASLSPLIVSIWWTTRGSTRLLAPIGLICAAIVVGTCASSTPLLALVLGMLAMLLYPMRRYLPWLRLAGVFMLIGLHLVMIAPVWHLLARISVVEGSTGWYRYKLIDEFIEHADEWWLLGTRSTEHWWTWGSADVTNQYVLEGVHGGLLTLLLFFGVLAIAFHAIGGARQHAEHLPGRRLLSWALGCSLLVHTLAFIAVSYFGQIIVVWYMTLAMAGTVLSIDGGQRLAVRNAQRSDGHLIRRLPARLEPIAVRMQRA